MTSVLSVQQWLTLHNLNFPVLINYSWDAVFSLLESPDKDLPKDLINEEEERKRLFAELRGFKKGII